MAIEVVSLNILASGTPPITSFADTMQVGPTPARNVLTTPSDAWIYLILSGDTPTAGAALPTFNFGATLVSGGLGCNMGALSFAATTYSMAGCIAPLVTYVGSPVYNAKQKFVQVMFRDVLNLAPVIGFTNWIDASGVGVAGSAAICHDGYTIRADTQGLLQRWNSGATNVTLHASLGAAVIGDVYRLSVDQTNPASIALTFTLNGVAQYTVTDTVANRVTGPMFPFLGWVQFAGGSQSAGFRNFSCGVGL